MKKVFSSLGKAVMYFLTYFGCQGIASIIISFTLIPKCMDVNGELDEAAYDVMYNESLDLILIVAGILTLIIYLIVTLIRKKNMLKELSVNKMNPIGIVPIVLMGISLNFLLVLFIEYMPFPQAWQDSYLESSSAVMSSSGIIFWISTVISVPVVEEVVFRGFIYSRLKTGTGKIVAVILTSLVFGCVHGTIIWAIYATILGLFLIWVFERFNSLWACILLHMAFNFVGAATTTWPSVFENLSPIVAFIGGAIVFIPCVVWCLKLTKNKDSQSFKSEPVSC